MAATVSLFPGALSGANLGSTAIDSALQSDLAPGALILCIDVTAWTGTSILPAFLFVDVASGKKRLWNSPAFATITGTGTYTYVLGSTGTQTTVTGSDITAVVNLPVPPSWAVRLTPVAVTNITATVTAYIVPLLN